MIQPIDLETGVYRRRLIIAVVATALLAAPVGLVVGFVGMSLFGMHDVSASFMVQVYLIEAPPRSLVVAVAAYYGERFSRCGWLYAVLSSGLLFWLLSSASDLREAGVPFAVLVLFGLVLTPVLIAYWSASSRPKAVKGNLHVYL